MEAIESTKEDINHSSQRLNTLGNKISRYERIIENKNNKSFCNHAILKVCIGNDKPVLDGGFTNLNCVEVELTSEEVLEIVNYAKDKAQAKQKKIIDNLKEILNKAF